MAGLGVEDAAVVGAGVSVGLVGRWGGELGRGNWEGYLYVSWANSVSGFCRARMAMMGWMYSELSVRLRVRDERSWPTCVRKYPMSVQFILSVYLFVPGGTYVEFVVAFKVPDVGLDGDAAGGDCCGLVY